MNKFNRERERKRERVGVRREEDLGLNFGEYWFLGVGREEEIIKDFKKE